MATFALIVGLILEAISVFLQWLNFRKHELTGLQRRILGHVRARLQSLDAALAAKGVVPMEDAAGDDAVVAGAMEGETPKRRGVLRRLLERIRNMIKADAQGEE